MDDRLLFVDDEPEILEGYRRLLHDEFDIATVQSGEQALAELHILGPYAVVVSDMQMPGMNGAELLARVRQLAPNTVRMLLTGCKDIDRAIEAVNEGRIFRYLTKPCKKTDLVRAINLGLAQYRANLEDNEAIKQAKEITVQAAKLGKMLLSRDMR